jgi:hypothetical protein
MTLTPTDLGLAVAAIGLGGVVVGGIVAGFFALVSGAIESSREHRRWLREQRFAAYRSAVSLLDEVRTYGSATTPTTLKQAKKRVAEGNQISAMLRATYNDVFILGPRKVSASLMRVTEKATLIVGSGGADKAAESAFVTLRAQFIRDIQDQLRAGWPWQRVTQDDAFVFKENKQKEINRKGT